MHFFSFFERWNKCGNKCRTKTNVEQIDLNGHFYTKILSATKFLNINELPTH